jgi:hypothetical protein
VARVFFLPRLPGLAPSGCKVCHSAGSRIESSQELLKWEGRAKEKDLFWASLGEWLTEIIGEFIAATLEIPYFRTVQHGMNFP